MRWNPRVLGNIYCKKINPSPIFSFLHTPEPPAPQHTDSTLCPFKVPDIQDSSSIYIDDFVLACFNFFCFFACTRHSHPQQLSPKRPDTLKFQKLFWIPHPFFSFFPTLAIPPVCVQLPRRRRFRLRGRHWLDNRTQLRRLRAPGQWGDHCAVWEHPHLSWSRYEHPGQCEWMSSIRLTINCVFNFYLQPKFLLKHSSSVSPPSACPCLCLWIAVYSQTLKLGLLYTAEQHSGHALSLSGRGWTQQYQPWGRSFTLTPGFCLTYLADREVLGDSPEAEDKPVLRRPHGDPPAAQVRRPVGAETRPLHPENPRHRCGNS